MLIFFREMNGTSKTRTHRFLNPRFELTQAMPDILHHQSVKIIASIKRGDRRKSKGQASDGMHPCTTTHVSYMMCLRRFADTYKDRCAVEATQHATCIKSNEFWEPEQDFDHLHFLEHFKIFSECRRFKKRDPGEILRQGMAAAIQFPKTS